jgi:hypothetical protein
MTTHHLGALAIAALIYVACEISGKCSERAADHAYQLAMAIIIGTVGLAGPAMQRARQLFEKKNDQHRETEGDGR